jgi:hypothetical protein
MCKGYGLRLSWPKPDDPRRSIVLSRQRKPQDRIVDLSNTNAIHVTHWDLDMYFYLREQTRNDTSTHDLPALRINIPYNPRIIDVDEKDLVQYFREEAHRSLTVFGDFDPAQLGELVLRAAFPTNTVLAQAVLQGLLALSFLQRNGLGDQAFQLKTESIGSLAVASKDSDNMNVHELVQQICASMLLCSFEVHQSSCSSNQWTWYIVFVRRLLEGPALVFWDHPDIKMLRDWASYHHITALFTLRHWRTDVVEAPKDYQCDTAVRPEVSKELIADTRMIQPGFRSHASPPTAILDMLAEICQTIPTKPPNSMPPHELAAYTKSIAQIEFKINSIASDLPSNSPPKSSNLVQLFKLALLIYLYRVSEPLLNWEQKCLRLVEDAFILLSQVETCERQFPVLILGCEAQTDEQRKIVLDLISRTEKSSCSRSFNHVSQMTRILWAQDFLADGVLNFWDKLTAVISCCSLLPSLV